MSRFSIGDKVRISETENGHEYTVQVATPDARGDIVMVNNRLGCYVQYPEVDLELVPQPPKVVNSITIHRDGWWLGVSPSPTTRPLGFVALFDDDTVQWVEYGDVS